MKQKIVIFTGAGISAESGIPTFRDSGGLWDGYDVEKVATPQGWKADRALVLDFYNRHRNNVRAAQPNVAHYALKELESKYDVTIITQNIDDLHERAGSTDIIHLHGEIMYGRSSGRHDISRYRLQDGEGIFIGDKSSDGTQMRPDVVWFGEEVPSMQTAATKVKEADIFIVIGTSMSVYPAASLVDFVKPMADFYVINPEPYLCGRDKCVNFTAKATEGVPELVYLLLK